MKRQLQLLKYPLALILCLSLVLSPFSVSAADDPLPEDIADNALPVVNITIDESAAIKAAEMTYSGSEQEPTFTVTFNGIALKEGEDFAVMAQKQTQPGSYHAIIYGIGSYCDYVLTEYTITKKKN